MASDGKIKIQLLHPIDHDGVHYGLGTYALDRDLAKLFLSFKDPSTRRPIAVLARKDIGR